MHQNVKPKAFEPPLFVVLVTLILTFVLTFVIRPCSAAKQCPHLFEAATKTSRPSTRSITPTIQSRMDSDGAIVLFRAIGGEYSRGATGSYSRTQRGYSYSLSPFVVREWAQQFLSGRKQILIARQNVNQDRLRYPSVRKLNRLLDRANGHVDLMSSRPYILLRPSTELADIAMLEEIKVPIGRERIEVIIDFDTFESALKGYSKSNFDVSSFLRRLARSS